MRLLPAVLFALLAISGLEAKAQNNPTPPSPDWTVTLGIQGRVGPVYEGSDSFVFRPVPVFSVRHSDKEARFSNPRDGASIGILDFGRFIAGPTVKVKTPRNEGDSTDLRGLGNVGWTVEAGAFAEYWPSDWLRTRVELRQGIGGHRGLVSDLTADVVMPVTPQLTLSAGPRMTLASSAAVSPYYSITPTQSAASGLAVYDARGGFRTFGAGAQARYAFSPKWGTLAYIEYDRLAGDVANSPLVVRYGSRDQVQVGLGVTYSFDVKALW